MLDENQVRKDWQARNFSFGIWEDPPGQVWSDFTHDVDELFMLVEGDVELIIDGESLYPEVGQEILVPANTMHTVKNKGTKSSRCFYDYKESK